jgi:trehalose-6-phosphate synthase
VSRKEIYEFDDDVVLLTISTARPRNGVCVLSRTAGASQQLHEAVIPISPVDIRETAKA